MHLVKGCYTTPNELDGSLNSSERMDGIREASVKTY